jgi:hypothetical protein
MMISISCLHAVRRRGQNWTGTGVLRVGIFFIINKIYVNVCFLCFAISLRRTGFDSWLSTQ